MMLPTLVVAAALLSSAQETPPVAPPPQETPAVAPVPQEAPPPSPVKTAELSSEPAVARTHLAAGLQAFKKRRFPKAEAEFRQALDADPGSAGASFYLGYTYYKMGEPSRRNNPNKQKAKELFAKAFEIDPQFKPDWTSKR